MILQLDSELAYLHRYTCNNPSFISQDIPLYLSQRIHQARFYRSYQNRQSIRVVIGIIPSTSSAKEQKPERERKQTNKPHSKFVH